MGKSFAEHSVVVGVLVAILVFSYAGWAFSEMGAGYANPHSSQMHCEVCHVLPKEKLESFFTTGVMKRQLRADPVAICRQCHNIGLEHGVGKVPEMNRDELPLAQDGTITCATTCHLMHVKNPADEQQEHYHLRLPIAKICFSCHEK